MLEVAIEQRRVPVTVNVGVGTGHTHVAVALLVDELFETEAALFRDGRNPQLRIPAAAVFIPDGKAHIQSRAIADVAEDPAVSN